MVRFLTFLYFFHWFKIMDGFPEGFDWIEDLEFEPAVQEPQNEVPLLDVPLLDVPPAEMEG